MAAKKYYAVKVGRTPGIYTDWDACSAQVHGFPGAQYKGFSTEADARGYLGVCAVPDLSVSDAGLHRGVGEETVATDVHNVEETVSHTGIYESMFGEDSVDFFPCQDSGSSSQVEDRSDGQKGIQPSSVASETYHQTDLLVKEGTVRLGDQVLGNDYAFVDGSYNISTRCYGYGGFVVHDGHRYTFSGQGFDEEMSAMRNVAGEIMAAMTAMDVALGLGMKELTICYDYKGVEMWATGQWKRNTRGTVDYYDYVQSLQDVLKLHFIKVAGHTGVEGNEEADRLAKAAAGIE